MINKRISKITIFASLLVVGVVNAQEFYTCVPKKSWWKDTMSESIRSNVPSAYAIANAVKEAIPTPQQPSSGWKLIKRLEYKNQYLEGMEFGKYKVSFCNKESEPFNVLSGESVTISAEKFGAVSYIVIITINGKPSNYYIRYSDYGLSCKLVIEMYKYE